MQLLIKLGVLFVVAVALSKAQQCDNVDSEDKFDCLPTDTPNQQTCEQRQCCWRPTNMRTRNPEQEFPPLNTPYCYYPQNYIGYAITSKKTTNNGDLKITLKRKIPSGVQPDIENLQVDVLGWNDNTVRIRITDANGQRWEPPVPVVPPRNQIRGSPNFIAAVDDAGNLIIDRKSVSDRGSPPLFKANLHTLVYTDQFLELSVRTPSNVLYGLGEHKGSLRKSMNWTRFTFFNEDRAPDYNARLYGTHPFYINVEQNGKANGLFLLSSNALDVILQPTPAVTYRSLGGILDFFFFVGPTPADVVKQYQQIVGLPRMPPYWSLGFHLCRFGYKSTEDTKEVMMRNINAGVPIDVQWNDIDYMDRRNDFTYDKNNFSGLPEFVKEVHDSGRHYVVIIDPGVSGSEPPGTYPPFDDGLKFDIFVKNITGGIVYAKVWNGQSTVFPDFTHPNATKYWTKQFQQFYDQIPIDGAWIDMNEPSNFYNGHKDGCPQDALESPPYVPGDEALQTRTLCLTDKHYWGPHYNIHNMYGYLEGRATYKALLKIRKNKRPFIISRSTFSGSGHWNGHWTGDVFSTWTDIRDSVPGILEFSLYGIPLVGVDICGFNGDTNVELCARWQALGAFYPFSRNHNSDDTIAQDPYILGPVVVNATVNSLKMRYMLLPYLYGLFYRSYMYGETVARPLFMEYPADSNVYDIDKQFLWGSGIMILPALYQNQTSVKAYLPEGYWYDFRSYPDSTQVQSTGSWFTFDAPMDNINVVARGGAIIPTQRPAPTTTEGRKTPFTINVFLDKMGSACGSLFWDDGETIDTVENNDYKLVTFAFKSNLLSITPSATQYSTDIKADTVIFFGVENSPKAVLLNNQSVPFDYNDKFKRVTVKCSINLGDAPSNVQIE